MTNQERLISLLGFNPPVNAAEAALLDVGVDKAANYTSDQLIPIKTAAVEIMKVLITTADTGNGVVGWTAKYDRPSILKRIEQLEGEINGVPAGPTIRGLQPW